MSEGDWERVIEQERRREGNMMEEGEMGEDRCNGVTHNVYNLRDVIKKQNDTDGYHHYMYYMDQ